MTPDDPSSSDAPRATPRVAANHQTPAEPAGPAASPADHAPPLRALVVDDEPLARRRLIRLLAEHADVAVVGEAEDADSAAELVAGDQPDLLFLDVQMPGADGFALLDAIQASVDARAEAGGAVPRVVFTTAYAAHAVRAFEVAAVDFLLKPIEAERLALALDRARAAVRAQAAGARTAGADGTPSVADAVRAELRAVFAGVRAPARYLDRLAVVSVGKTVFVPVRDVDWIAAESNYARVHAGGRQYLMRTPMSTLEERLDPQRFVRVHRSAIVALDRVRELRTLAPGVYRVVLHDNTQVEVHRSYRHRLPQPP